MTESSPTETAPVVETSGNAARWKKPLRLAGCFTLFLSALIAARSALNIITPFPPVPTVESKLAHLSAHADEYDTLFIGSSRVYRHILPSVFDRTLKERGLSSRSFNAGVDGMRPPEVNYLFSRIAALRPKKLKWVFIELAPLRTIIDRDKFGTIRAVYWHDWERLSLLWERTTHQTRKRKPLSALREMHLGEFATHVQLFMQNQLHQGRGAEQMDILRSGPRTISQRPLGPDLDGFQEADRPQIMEEPYLGAYRREFAERLATPAKVDLADPISQKALASMVQQIESLGARAVLLVMPTTNKKNFFPTPGALKNVVVLDYSDPRSYEDLFAEENRMDTDHLNTKGAVLFSEILASHFASLRLRSGK